VRGDIAKTFASFPNERKLVFKNLATVDRLRYLEAKKEFNAKVNKVCLNIDCWDTHCSPFRFYKLLQNIGSEYNDSISSIRLEGLIHLQEYKLNRHLCLWLIEMVDLNKRDLEKELPMLHKDSDEFEGCNTTMNLSKHVCEILLSGISNFRNRMKKKDGKTTWLSGCVLILQIVFLYHISGTRFDNKYGQYFFTSDRYMELRKD
ncbi:hypothetical protein QQP08_009818, partial [Theobroma cacao]